MLFMLLLFYFCWRAEKQVEDSLQSSIKTGHFQTNNDGL